MQQLRVASETDLVGNLYTVVDTTRSSLRCSRVATAAAYSERKAAAVDASRCLRCTNPPAEDSLLCLPHLESDRKYKRDWAAKRRRKRRRAKECGDCGEPLRGGARIWCKAHRIQRNLLRALLARGGVDISVEKSERIAARTVTHEDGRTRHHGQGRRRQQTHAQMNRQDVLMASKCYGAFKVGIELLGSEEAKTWHRGERERFTKATASQGESLVGHIDDILERIGHFKAKHGTRDG
jgi:hypothetical protein